MDPLGSSACSDRARRIVSRDLGKIDVDVRSATGPCYATSRSTNAQGGRLAAGILRYYVFSGDDSREEGKGFLSGKRENNSNVR